MVQIGLLSSTWPTHHWSEPGGTTGRFLAPRVVCTGLATGGLLLSGQPSAWLHPVLGEGDSTAADRLT